MKLVAAASQSYHSIFLVSNAKFIPVLVRRLVPKIISYLQTLLSNVSVALFTNVCLFFLNSDTRISYSITT